MKVLVVDLFPAIWNHSLLLAQMSSVLAKNSKEIQIIRLECGKTFPNHCLSRDYLKNTPSPLANGMNPSCKTCGLNNGILTWNKKYPTYELSQYVDYVEADRYIETLSILESDELLKCRDMNINIGELAAYEFLLKYKKRDFALNEQERQEFLENIRNWILTFKAATLILNEAKPSKVVIFNPQYSVNSAVAKASKLLGIPVYAAECSDALDKQYSDIKISLWREKFNLDALASWPGKGYQPSSSMKLIASKHFEKIRKANSVFTYSSKPIGESPRKFFDVPIDAKMVLVALSSQDEFFAGLSTGLIDERKAISQVFETQTLWVKFILNYALMNPDIYFVIRLHPREFPNKRENMMSKSATELIHILSRIPENVRIDTPQNNLSITDYFIDLDVFTTGWSNSALEAGYEGIPVVIYDEAMPFFPSDLYLNGKSRTEYSKNLDLALTMQRDSNIKEATLNWIAWSTIEGTIVLGGRAIDRSFASSRVIQKVLYNIHPRLRKIIDIALPVVTKDSAILSTLFETSRENIYSAKELSKMKENGKKVAIERNPRK